MSSSALAVELYLLRGLGSAELCDFGLGVGCHQAVATSFQRVRTILVPPSSLDSNSEIRVNSSITSGSPLFRQKEELLPSSGFILHSRGWVGGYELCLCLFICLKGVFKNRFLL